MTAQPYHYTESGLETVYLLNGYEVVNSTRGTGVKIHDIDGLHAAIGRSITENKKRLSGNEFRFFRNELLMSQASLAQLLQVKELTIARWEKEHAKIPVTTDATIRALYQEHIHGDRSITDILRSLADLEDRIDQMVMQKEADGGWDRAA
jgi:putative transcriptional regulator